LGHIKSGGNKKMSKPFSANEAQLAYINEVTYGETPTNPTMIIITAESVEPAIDPKLIEVRGIGSRGVTFAIKGLRTIDLKFLYALQDTTLLNSVISLASFSAEMLYVNPGSIVSLLHKGCIPNKATVECTVEDLIKVTMECIGQNLTVGTASAGTSYTPVTTEPISFYESYVKKGTSAIERVTAWKFMVENNLKRVPVIRSTNGDILKYLMERQINITGELEFEFESKEEYDDVINDVSFALELGLGGSNKATISDCKWTKVSTPTKVSDLIALKAPFIAKGITIA
jgi:hypothetical protein